MDVFGQMAAVAVVLLLLGATLWALRQRGFAGVALTRKSGGRRMEVLWTFRLTCWKLNVRPTPGFKSTAGFQPVQVD